MEDLDSSAVYMLKECDAHFSGDANWQHRINGSVIN